MNGANYTPKPCGWKNGDYRTKPNYLRLCLVGISHYLFCYNYRYLILDKKVKPQQEPQ
nr:MAG TPA: hypothetical protein [Caudoviricetes sp.]